MRRLRLTTLQDGLRSQSREMPRLRLNQQLGLHQVQHVTMIRRHDQQRFVPVAVGFHPLGNDFDRIVAAVDCTDRSVNVVVVVGPIDVTGFDHDPERCLVAAQHRDGCGRHIGECRIFFYVSGRVRFAFLADTGRGIVTSISRGEGQMAVVLTVAEESQQAIIAFRGCRGRVLQHLRTLVSGGAHGSDVLPAVIDADRLQVGVRQFPLCGETV